MADNVITNLSIEVTSSADKAASTFDRLASSAGRLRGAASGAAGGMQGMAQGAQDAGTATQEAGTQAGSAAPKIRSVGKAAKDAGDNAKKGASGLATFWQSLKRIAFYRFVRSIIKEVTEAFKTGITNLYHWSDAMNGHFASTMDRLATSSQYLKNSLGAMVSPLIETLVPVLDTIIDKVVDVLNFFNMLVAAVSGADTYTVAKKAAAVWDDSASKTKKSAKSAADSLKRTILGFDEINKLVKPNSSSGGSGSSSGKKQPNYSAMFEEKPLTGLFKKISDITSGWPDWLKALLGVGTAGLAIFGIPALLKAIYNWLKKLFTMHIPDFFKWLFSPKGNGNGGFDLPKEIKLPDAELPIDLKKDDWSILDDIKTVDIMTDLKRGWPGTVMSYLNLNHLATQIMVDLVRGWPGTVLSYLNLNHLVTYITVDLVRGWRGTVLSYLNLNNLKTSVKVNLVRGWVGTVLSYLNLNHLRTDVIVDLKRGWPGTVMSYLNLNYLATVVAVDLKRAWSGTVMSYLNLNYLSTNVAVNLVRNGWYTIQSWIGYTDIIARVYLTPGNFWSLRYWIGDSDISVFVNLYRGNFWSLIDWVGDWVSVAVYLYRGNFWSLQDWVGSQVTVRVNLVMGKGGTIKVNGGSSGSNGTGRESSNKFGGASSGGAGTKGGGVGRGRKALGGVYDGSHWLDIPQYAYGTYDVNHGTLFWAGENGSEVVGKAGGRTEVLNRSQIASAIYSAVSAAMAPAAANFAAAAENIGVAETGFDFETLADMVRQGVEQAMSRSNDYDRQKVELLRSINDKDFNVDVSTASINKAQLRMNRRAGVTIAPVGT